MVKCQNYYNIWIYISWINFLKLYFIYELYKNATISSKYIGLNHYRRYFDFCNNIPNLDNIFENHDVILSRKIKTSLNNRDHYCKNHICQDFDEIIDIIKEIKPEYYKTAIKTSKEKQNYYFNLFIMKKYDFYNYCKFMYDILFEFLIIVIIIIYPHKNLFYWKYKLINQIYYLFNYK